MKIIRDAILRWARGRAPDFVIGGHDRPYLRRHWLLPRNPLFNVYVHEFLRSDDDRALHDHPFLFNVSWILEGCYREWTFLRDYWFTHAHSQDVVANLRDAGSLKFRWGKAPHRVDLLNHSIAIGDETIEGAPIPCWTVFITGPRPWQWGFYCERGWIHWKKFTAPDDKGAVGAGCDA